MWRKLLIANITEANSEEWGQGFATFTRRRTSLPNGGEQRSAIGARTNSGFRSATGSGGSYVSAGIKGADGGWVHQTGDSDRPLAAHRHNSHSNRVPNTQ